MSLIPRQKLTWARFYFFSIGLLLSSSAFARTTPQKFKLLISLSGAFIAEHERGNGDKASQAASPFSLGYGDLRFRLELPNLPSHFAFVVDGRLRLTGNFSTAAATLGANQVISRGYLGGREYELRTAFLEYRGDRFQLAAGRLIIPEADALRLDGLRLRLKFGSKWDANVYGGAYPNPYSRSLTSDYQNTVGYYGLSFVGGVSSNYAYDHYWGGASLNGAYLGGPDDGGRFDPASPAGTPTTEGGRLYLTWFGFEKPLSMLEFYHSLVLDFLGRGGVQLTRLDLLATFHAGRNVTIRTGYDHLSSFALEMFVTTLLANRPDFSIANTITNNLIVGRTARDEGRLYVDFHTGKFTVYSEGRLRLRSIVGGGENPQFVDANGNSPISRLAYDVSFGLRDLGSFQQVRFSLNYSYWVDYRNLSHVVSLGVGRSFWQERFNIDLALLYARLRDETQGAPACDAGVPTAASPASLVPACWGSRNGHSIEAGPTFTIGPIQRWFGFLDYRIVTNITDGKPLLFTHALLARVEYRY